MQLVGQVALAALWFALVSGCTDTDVNEVGSSLSSRCRQCLTEDRSSEGCAKPFATCEQDVGCDEYVTCQLMGRCYEQRSGSGCEERIGCEEPSSSVADADAGAQTSPAQVAAAFEKCARSKCAAVCGFVK